MNAVQQEDNKMTDLVIDVYVENKKDFELIPELATTMEKVIVVRNGIKDIVELQIKDTKGNTKGKMNLKSELALLTSKIAKPLFTWAKATKNAPLMQQAKVTEAKLKKINDKLICPTCRIIKKLASANVEALKKYGVTADMVDKLDAVIDTYDSASPTVRKQILDRTGYTQKLADIFIELNGLLKDDADNLIVNLVDMKPDTYRKYMAARVLPRKKPGKKNGSTAPPTTPPPTTEL